MKLKLLALLCLAVLGTILTLGLWPFHSPGNNVHWLENRNGLRIRRFGSVVSSGSFPVAGPQNPSGASLELWAQPVRIWDSGGLLTFYEPGNAIQFSLRQSQTDLQLLARDEQRRAKAATLSVNGVFRRNAPPAFITVTCGGQGAWIYIDGVLAVAAPQFQLTARSLSGRMVLGDSPGQPDSWSGQLFGFAIYHRKLTAAQVLHNYAAWQRTGRPEMGEDERNVALFLFDEHAGDVARDKSQSGVYLRIPKRYEVEQKIFLEPFWTEFSMSRSYWSAVLKNIVGFIPLGFCFYAFLVELRRLKRPALVTVVLGCAVSFTIEILQAFLPTRDSGATDIITNTLGAWVGVAAYQVSIPTLARFLPWLPPPAPRRK